MAALVRHDTVSSWALACFGTDDGARERPCFSATGAFKAAGARFPAPTYVHHVPGRLRLKAPEFRQDPEILEAARRELTGLGGVGSVSTNLLTGSILVEYDPQVLAPAALLRAMQECGFPNIRLRAPPLDTAGQTSLPESFAGVALRTLFELFVERLVVAVVVAVI